MLRDLPGRLYRVRLVFCSITLLLLIAACAPTPIAVPSAATAVPSIAPPSSATSAPASVPTLVPPTSTPAPTATQTLPAPPTVTHTSTPAPTATRTATPTVAPTDAPRAHVKLTRFQVNKVKDPNAACNDGSTPVFYFERGYGSGVNKWVLFLQGGGDCWDTATCSSRTPAQKSSNPASQPDLDKPGLLSDQPSEDPDFYSWNHVYAPYCSSDDWSGASADNNNPMKFYFRGRYNLDGVVDAISDAGIVGAPTLHEATNILIGGSSSGGIGVRINLDRLAKSLSWADVRGMMDSDMLVPTNPAFTQADQDQRGQSMMALYKPSLDESCQAASTARPWLCIVYAYAVVNKQISTPLFVRQDLYDPLNLEMQGLDPKNVPDRQYVSEAADQYSQILSALPGAFGTATGDHVLAETEKFNTDKVDGLTFAQVLGNWYFNRSGPKVVVAPARR